MNSNFPYRWSPASLAFNNYFYLFLYLYITRITINNNAPHLKSPKNQNRRAALGRPAMELLGEGGGGALTSLLSTNPRPWFCLGSSDKTFITKVFHYNTKTIQKHLTSIFTYFLIFLKILTDSKSRKENPQKLTQLSSRSHPRHLVGKRTAQKDITIDTTSDSQVNSNFPNRWSPASLTFNNYFYLFLYLYIT